VLRGNDGGDNTFALGFASLARIYLVEHRINLGAVSSIGPVRARGAHGD